MRGKGEGRRCLAGSADLSSKHQLILSKAHRQVSDDDKPIVSGWHARAQACACESRRGACRIVGALGPEHEVKSRK